ncbi:thioredoxin domain-containing protein [Empedobacter stercoris]|uniref:thioredoxin domain-containing protein n=1 Tax=Empedobacter stercoris TaxID=1628248 RepID=UPI0016622033|nr:thioredoxin domain-containing protein [Empedobacter stercoris]MCA4809631.1 thioredoxin domain-containing protein [Empedobacter stercoris]QNT14663.1 thioredoxin domain-containing protein [Empedobacter stercoris]
MNFQQNNLKNATSPYLKQHENNPVWWQSWSDKVLNHAQEINKPLLISIGYSACHWCHVMEHQSFEDETVAKLMNKYFVCIKIDREERPDLDALYMNVSQLIHQSGGWPLNVFALPDGRPFYGGTYFPKVQWIELLENINHLYHENYPKTMEYVNSIADGLHKMETIELKSKQNFSKEKIDETFEFWRQQFDDEWGGFNRAPKFMLTNAWETILRYGIQTKNENCLIQTKITLDRMAFGGIYDQLKGGFSRYSVDPYWKVPHFEKMLYDNGQLLSLYSNAYRVFNEKEYENIVKETINWLKDEMLSPENVFYAAIDADSEGEEGKYYVWKSDELKLILKEDFDLFQNYYNIDEFGEWEHGNNILMRLTDDEDFATKQNISVEDLQTKVSKWKKILNPIREKRIKPHRDEKVLTSWNALTIKGLCDAYLTFEIPEYLDLAENAIHFILENQWKNETLFRNYKDKQTTIPGFLDDYALMIEALIKLFEITSEIKYLETAQTLTEETFNQFYNHKNKMFAYKSHYDTPLVNETFEIYDNVISSSNSVMATNLFKLGKILNEEKYIEQAKQMLTNIDEKIHDYPTGFANWIQLYLNFSYPFKEIVIVGNEAQEYSKQIQQCYVPNAIFVASETEQLEITKNRLIENKTSIHICENYACQLPVYSIEEAYKNL